MDRISIALTIAGSDSGGGAGIQADLKTFHQYNVYGTSVLTSVTAQNTCGVSAIHSIPAEMVRAQWDAVIQDLPPAAIKSGMVCNSEVIQVISDGLRMLQGTPYILDPVMISTQGQRLIDESAQSAIVEFLVPLATVLTPNLPEAEALTGRRVRDVAGMRDAGKALLDMGARAVLLKGGHLPGSRITDLLLTADDISEWHRPRLKTRHTHGTGCTLAAAIAAALARGDTLYESVDLALGFVARAIDSAPGIGSGNGPLNHFVRP